MNKIFTTLFAMLLSVVLLGQSPGGVGTPAAWYKADAISLPDNILLGNWADVSGGGFDLIQVTPGNQPTFSNATTLANFNPTVTFNGVGQKWMAYLPANNGGTKIMERDKGALFSAGNTTAEGAMFGFGNAHLMDDPGIYNFTGNKLLFYPRLGDYTPQSTHGINGPYIGSGTWENSAGTGVATRNNHILMSLNGFHQIYDSNINNVLLDQSRNDLRVGRDDWKQFIGQQNEMIIFPTKLTDLEMNRVESYLAIKYGQTLSKEQNRNYLRADGTVVWDGSVTAYYHNVAGIARDNASALHQKQSKSVNDNQKLIIGAGSGLFQTNAANTNSLSDGQFLLFGDNGLKQSLHTPLAYTAGSNGKTNFRFESIWKVQNTNNVGTVTVAWPKGVNNLYLVQSADETFDTSDTFTPMTTEVTVSGVVYNTATVTLADGEFFTFAGYGYAPGGVANNLSYWYRADMNAENTGEGTDITTWTDVWSGATSEQLGANELPKFKVGAANYFNFNPGVNFTTRDQSLGNISVQTLTNVDYDIFTLTKEGMLESGTQRRFFNIGMDNTTFSGTNWDSPAFTPDGRVIRRTNTGAGPRYQAIPGNVVFSPIIPSIMYHTFGDTSLSKGLNGASNGTTATHGAIGQVTGGHIFGSNRGSSTGGDDLGFIGHIGETIIYGEGNLSEEERRRVDSYLAIKYGITLDRVATDHYLGADGSKVWDGEVADDFNNNIFGIAREDISAFDQKVSKSVTAGSILSIATNNDFVNGNLDVNRNALPNDASYFLLGDNNDLSDVTETITEIGDCGEIFDEGVEFKVIPRKWRAQRTNDIEVTYLQVNLAAYANELNSGVQMLIADDENFTQNVKMVPGVQDENNWVFTHNFDNEATERYITFGGIYEAAPCEQCQGGTYTLKTGREWNKGAWNAQINNEVKDIYIGDDADGNPITADMYADYTQSPSMEYVPRAYPRQYGGKWTMARRYDNSDKEAIHSIELSHSMKASFQISNINTFLDNKNNFQVKGYCNGSEVTPKITYAYNTPYHTFDIQGGQAIGTMSWRGFVPNVSTANIQFSRPVQRIEIITKVERVNNKKTLRSDLYGDITLECAEVLEPTPDNVYVSHNFTQDELATCGGETTMRIKVTNNNLCEDKTIDLHQFLPSGLTYVDGSFNGNDLPAGAMDNATLTYSGSNFELSGLTLPRGEHYMYVDIENPGVEGTYPTEFTFKVTDGVDPNHIYSSSIVDLTYYESSDPSFEAPTLTLTVKDDVTCGENDAIITYRMKIDNPNDEPITGAEIMNMFDYDQEIVSVDIVDDAITGEYPIDGGGVDIEPVGSTLFNMINTTIPVGVSYIDITVNLGSSYDIAEVQTLGISSSFIVGFGSGECAESAESISNEVVLMKCIDTPCTKPGAEGDFLTSSVGITTKGDPTVANWPKSVPNGYLVLDSADKGMVITHMSTAEIEALAPVKGMLVYDTDVECVKLYRGAGDNAPLVHPNRQGWVCIEKICND